MATSASYQRPRFLAPGDKLGKYDLIRQIAIGGMAELYLARTVGIEGFEKLVVVKRILPQFMANQQFVGMFLNEARLAATLHHPNIAQVYDIGVEEGDYFFSMEYIHGEDLGRLNATAIENGVPLSLDAALTLAAGLCAGLHYAHEKSDGEGKPLDVVHRDVSPSNVLVSYDGGVKLVDFGIARASSHQTTQGGLKGKIAYMSPEQCKGNIKLDRRSDIFSVGALLFELTTGRTPFNSETEYGILNQIVNEDVPAPSSIVPGYPPALERIVMQSLSRDPEKRIPTALALQGALEDFAHENRLRVSPLVLARVMSSLFPARLEEWEHARKQGAFFVEQHVLQTLIENKRSDSDATSPPFAPDHDATGVDTQITTMPGGTQSGAGEEVTNVLGIVAAMPPMPEESVPVPQPIGVAPSAPPPLSPAPLPPRRLPTPVPGLNLHPRMPTPVPNMPGAVPIIGAFDNAPAMPLPAPIEVPSSTTLPVPPTDVDDEPRGRSRFLVIAIAALAVVGLGATAFVISRKATRTEPAALTGGNETGKTGIAGKVGDDDTGANAGTADGGGAGGAGSTDVGATGERGTGSNGSTGATGTTVGNTATTRGATDATDGSKASRDSTGSKATGATNAAGSTGSKATAGSTSATDGTKATTTKATTKTTTRTTTKSTTKSTTKTDHKGSAWNADSPFLPVPTKR